MGNDYGRFYVRLRKEQRQEQGIWDAIGPELLMALREAQLRITDLDTWKIVDTAIEKAERLIPDEQEDENYNSNGE